MSPIRHLSACCKGGEPWGHAVAFLIVILWVLALDANGAAAQTAQSTTATTDAANTSTVSIISEDFAGSLRWMADDLATGLSGEEMLVLPVFGVGSEEMEPDLLYLKSIDTALIHSDFLAYVERYGLHSEMRDRLRFIAKLFVKEVAVLAGPSVTSVNDLAGRKVGLGDTTSSGLATARLLFDLLGVDVEIVRSHPLQALDNVRSGDIAAIVLVEQGPNRTISTLSQDDQVKLVPIELSAPMQDIYVPVEFSGADYPNFLGPQERVQSVGVSVVLAMYNWPPLSDRYNKVARFVELFFSRFADIQATSDHPAWQDVNLTQTLPGWTRFKPATDWLARHGNPKTGGALSNLRKMFLKFVELQSAGTSEELTQSEEAALFKLFLAWAENPDEAVITMNLTSRNGTGREIGTIRARNTQMSINGEPSVGLVLKPLLTGLPVGSLAVHVHAKPNCGPEQKDGVLVVGLGAGGFLSPQDPGREFAQPPSELPKLVAGQDGTAKDAIVIPGLSLADLPDRSIVIYANADAGSDRLACGVVD